MGRIGAGVYLIDECGHDGEASLHAFQGSIEYLLEQACASVGLVYADGAILIGIFFGQGHTLEGIFRQVFDHIGEEGPLCPEGPGSRGGKCHDLIVIYSDEDTFLFLISVSICSSVK